MFFGCGLWENNCPSKSNQRKWRLFCYCVIYYWFTQSWRGLHRQRFLCTAPCPLRPRNARSNFPRQTGTDHSTTAWHPTRSEDHWNPVLQSGQSQTWLRTARERLSEEVKVILTRIKAQIWTLPDTLIAPHSQLKLSQRHCNASS